MIQRAAATDAAAAAARRVSHARLRRDLALFLGYRLLSTSYLFVPVFLLFLAARGLSVTEITLLNTVYCGTLIAFEVPTGVLADRWGRRRAMVLGSLLMAAGCLLDFAGHRFVTFAVGEGLLALGMTLSSGADSAYLYDLLRDAGREREYRRHEGAASAAKLVGAAAALAAGGWLAGRSLGATYIATAVVCALAAVFAALLHEEPQAVPPRRAQGIAGQIADSARTVLTHPPLAFAVMFSTLVFTLVRMALYLHQPYLTRAGYSIERVGVILAALSVAAAWGAARIDTLRRLVGERGLVVGLPLLLAGSYFALGQRVATWGIGLMLLQSVVNGVYSPLSKELLNREIADSAQRATVLSVDSMVRRMAFGLFAPLCGLLIDARGLAGGLYACAGLGLVGAAMLARRIAVGRGPAPASAALAEEAVPDVDSGRLAADLQR